MLLSATTPPRIFAYATALAIVAGGLLIDLRLIRTAFKGVWRDALRAPASPGAFTPLHAQVALLTVLALALPALAGRGVSGGVPTAKALLTGMAYNLSLVSMLVAFCLTTTRLSPAGFLTAGTCPRTKALRKGALYGIAVIPLVVFLILGQNLLLDQLGVAVERQEVFAWLEHGSWGVRALLALSSILIAPCVEEVLFRGILWRAWREYHGTMASTLLSSLCFAALHCHLPSFLPLFLLGLCFSLGYAATGSLLTPMAMHLVFNTASLVFWIAGW